MPAPSIAAHLAWPRSLLGATARFLVGGRSLANAFILPLPIDDGDDSGDEDEDSDEDNGNGNDSVDAQLNEICVEVE